MVLAAGLHIQLGTLREQPQLRGNCFAKKRKLRGPENACRLRKSAHALAALGKVPGSELMRIRGQYSTLVRPRLALARGGMAKPADLPPGIRSQTKSGRRWRSEPMHGTKCSTGPGAASAPAPAEAASRMQLLRHLRQVSTAVRQKKRALAGTCRLEKNAPDKVSLDRLAEGGAAINADRLVNSIRPRLHPLRLDVAKANCTNFSCSILQSGFWVFR